VSAHRAQRDPASVQPNTSIVAREDAWLSRSDRKWGVRELDMARLYTVRRLKIGRTEQMDALARAAGDLYSQVVVWCWRTVRRKDLWLKAKQLMHWLTSALLHAHSSDAVVQSFFAALASWHARRKIDHHAHPPRRRKRFYRVQWKATAMTAGAAPTERRERIPGAVARGERQMWYGT
jgi:hypothetical protein